MSTMLNSAVRFALNSWIALCRTTAVQAGIERALALQLTDRLSTSDAFLQSHAEHSDLVEVRYRAKRGWQERIGVAAELAVERGFRRLLRSEQDQRFL